MAEKDLINEEDKDYIDSLPNIDEEDDDDTSPSVSYQQTDDTDSAIINQSEQEYIDNVDDDPDVFSKEIPDNNTQSVERNEPSKNLSLLYDREARNQKLINDIVGIPSKLKSIYKDVAPQTLGGDTNYKKAIIMGGTDAYASGINTVGDVIHGVAKTAPLGNHAMFANFAMKFISGDQPTRIEEIVQKAYPEYTEKVEKQFGEDYILYRLANNIRAEAEKEFGLEEDEKTVTNDIVRGLTQFFAPYGAIAKTAKFARGYKGAYKNELITGFAFFDEDEQNVTNMLEEFGVYIPVVTDILAKDEDDAYVVKKIKAALEAVLLIAPFDAGKIADDILVAHKHKVTIDKAKLELLEDGVVSQSTAELLEQTSKAVGELQPVNISPFGEVPETAQEKATRTIQLKVKDELEQKAAKYSDEIKKVRGVTEEKKADQIRKNKEEAEKNIEMSNKIVEDFEAKLSVNNDIPRDSPDFVHISKKVFGRRVLNTELLRKAKNMESKPSFIEKESTRVTEAGEAVGDIIIPPRNSADARSALFNKTLTPENIDALTVVFSEMKRLRPDLWNDKLPPMKAAYKMVVKLSDEGIDMNFKNEHPLFQALEKAGMSFEDFTVHGLGAASEAGQILRSFRNVKQSFATEALKREYALRELLNKQGSAAKFMRRIENIRRGGLVSQIATAARNLESGLIRAPVEAINNIVETAVYDLSRGGLTGLAQNRVFKRTTWQDSFAHLRYIFANRKTAEEYTDFILEEKELKIFYDQMFNTINEIQLHTGRGSGGASDAILSMGEDFVQLLNTPNRWQDFMLRRAMFLGEARRLFRLEWDIDLIEELKNGRIKDILRDAEDLNPTGGKKPALDIFAEATQRALDLTYASAPEVPWFNTASKFIVQNNLTVAIPFPRFMFKSMELMAENSGGALVPVINKVYRDVKIKPDVKKAINDLETKQADLQARNKDLSDTDKAKLKQLKGVLEDFAGDKGTLTRRESRSIARNASGLLAISAATMYAYEQLEGQDYKFISDGQGNVIDTTPLFPLRQFLFLGKLGKAYFDATRDLPTLDLYGAKLSPQAAKEAFVETFPVDEWIETFTGTNFRLGIGGNLLDEVMTLFDEKDLTSGERAGKAIGEIFGEWAASFLVPLNQVIDAQRALGERGLVYKEMANDPEIFPKGRFLEGVFKPFKRYSLDPKKEEEAPIKFDPLQGERQRVNIGLKVGLGINMYSEDSEDGRFLKSLGFSKYDLSSKSDIPSVRNFENELIFRDLPNIVDYIKELKEDYEDEYEEDRENLSTGVGAVSKKVYVKTRIKDDIEKEINFYRNNLIATPREFQDKAIKLEAMINYRRMPKDIRREATLEFKRETGRFPSLKYSLEELNEMIPDFENLSQEEQKYEINELKLNDIYLLNDIGKSLIRKPYRR